MADDFPFARPHYKAYGGAHANEMARLRMLFMAMFKGDHANKIGIMSSFASLALYHLAEDHSLRRHLRAEMMLVKKPLLVVENDILSRADFYEQVEALFLTTRPVLSPEGAVIESHSEPDFSKLSPTVGARRKAAFDARHETLRKSLQASEFDDWHTDAARRRAEDPPHKVSPHDPNAKKKPKDVGGTGDDKKTANLAGSATKSMAYPGMGTLTFDNTNNAQPGSSTNWAVPAYPESIQDHDASHALSTPSSIPNTFAARHVVEDNFNNTSKLPTLPRLALSSDYRLNNQSSGSLSDSGYSSLHASPTSDESPSGLRAFEPRQSAVRGMQFTADEETVINTGLAGVPHRLPTLPVVGYALQNFLFSFSLPAPRHKSFPEAWSKPTHIVPSHSPQAVAEGAWSYDENDEAYWVPYTPGASFQPQDQGFYQDGSQCYQPGFMQQQQPDSQDAPPLDAMEYEAIPGWGFHPW